MAPMLAAALRDSLLLRGTFMHVYSVNPNSHMNRWDPATGLGTPNYPKMKELFLALP